MQEQLVLFRPVKFEPRLGAVDSELPWFTGCSCHVIHLGRQFRTAFVHFLRHKPHVPVINVQEACTAPPAVKIFAMALTESVVLAFVCQADVLEPCNSSMGWLVP